MILIRIPVFLVALILLMQGCSPLPIREWPGLEGRVLDAQTEEPIEGAFVVARWIGYGGYSQSQCFHVEVAETDEQGRYRIAPWRNDQDSAILSNQRQSIERVHAEGYRESQITRERESYRQGVYYLEKDEGDAEDRLKYLRNAVIGCSSRYGNKDALIAFYKALHHEVAFLPESHNRNKTEIWLQNHIDEIEMGFESAEKLYIKRLELLERGGQ